MEKHFIGQAAQSVSKFLGHAGAATYPDRPYLQYQFDFERPRPDKNASSMRDNSATFLEGCKCLHAFFSKYAKAKYPGTEGHRTFRSIEKTLREVIACEADKDDRIKAWDKSGLIKGCARYNPETWEQEKLKFSKYSISESGISTNAYRFHQAATFHRYYVLKDLLPDHGIAVY